MTEHVQHYAIIGVGRAVDNPSGLVRRRYMHEGRIDEALQRDMTWVPTSAITQWEFGNYPGELAKLTEEEAEQLIERFREKWGAQGG